MEQRPCPRCGTPCTDERCPACGAFVPPSLADILTGGELLTHGQPEPVGDPAPATADGPHEKDPADRTDEIPVIRDDTPPPPDLHPTGGSAEVGPPVATPIPVAPQSEQTLPTTGAMGAGRSTGSSSTGSSAASSAGSSSAAQPDSGPIEQHAAPQRFGPALAATSSSSGRRRRGPVIAVAVGTALVLTIGVVLALVLRQPPVDGVAQPAETVVSTVSDSAAPSAESTTPESVEVAPSTSAAPPETTAEATSEPVAETPSSEPPSSPPSSSAPAAPIDEDIACQAGGWMVQLASEGDEGTYTNRVAALQALGQVPEGSKTARTGSSCGIFTTQTNSIVLWAGPFATAYDACPARWAGPPDAFVKGTTPDLARTYFSCLCPGDPTTYTWLQTGSTDVVLIGELQRILGNRLNTPIPDLQGNWGTFTPGTQAAVSTFQTKSGLPATGIVDTATWVALNTAQCS